MSFDTLISLLIFVFFIVIPLLSRLGRQRRPPRRPPVPPPDGRPPLSTTGTETPPSAPTAPPLEEEFSRRLEEARRRVQEALGGGPEATSMPTTPMPTTPMPTTPMPGMGPGGPSQSPSGSSGQLLMTPDTQPPPSLIPRMVPERHPAVSEAEMARPLVISRRTRRAARAKLTARGLIPLDRRSIVRGFIWHFVLSDPLSKRASRRSVSPPRSP